MKMRQSISQFEVAFEQETALERRRREQLRRRAANRSRARRISRTEQRDVYDRLLAYVYLGDRFVNAELVRRGFARSLTIPPNDRFAALFRRAERRAGIAGRGLWGACGP